MRGFYDSTADNIIDIADGNDESDNEEGKNGNEPNEIASMNTRCSAGFGRKEAGWGRER